MLVNQSSAWHKQQQHLMLLPVNLIDLIWAALPHLQDPGTGVRLQLEVTLQKREESNIFLQQIPALFWLEAHQVCHDNGVHDDRLGGSSQGELKSPGGLSWGHVKAVSFQQKMFQLVLCCYDILHLSRWKELFHKKDKISVWKTDLLSNLV